MQKVQINKSQSKGDFARTLGVNTIYIEMTNICNFNCSFCPIRFSKRKPGRIEMGLFQKIINEIAATSIARRVGFHILGEPLMHPDLVSAISYASGKEIETTLSTNGALLSRDKVQALIDSGLSHINISLETTDEKEHEARGAPVDFPRYYAVVIDAIAALKKNPNMRITVSLINSVTKGFFALDHDIGLILKGKEFKENLIPLIYDINHAIGRTKSREEIARAIGKVGINSSKNIWIDDQIKLYVQLFWDWGNAFALRKIYPAKFGFCGYAFNRLGILHDGRVLMCCSDYDGETAIGNVKDRPLIELLESDFVKQVVDGFHHSRVTHPYCQRCLGSTSRLKTLLKGIASIYLFKGRGHPLHGAKRKVLFGKS